MKRSYQVFYYIKAHRAETLHHMFVMASNKKEAVATCRQVVYERTGRNAFRPWAERTGL